MGTRLRAGVGSLLLGIAWTFCTAISADPPSDLPATSESERRATEPKLSFSFRFAPWKEVLEWLAKESNLSLQLDTVPPGTLNYVDSREHTPSEAIDLVNRVLLTKGYTLVRHERLLTVINLEGEAAAVVLSELLPVTPVTELKDRGKFELTKCMFELTHASPSAVEQEIRPLLGPQGSMRVIAAARKVMVVETGGKLTEPQQALIETALQELRRGGHDESPIRVLPQTTQDVESMIAALQTIWRRNNAIRLAPAPAPLPPLRQVTPSRLRSPSGRSGAVESQSNSPPHASEAHPPRKPVTDEGTSRKVEPNRRMLRAPSGPVRVVHIEGTDLLLIRATGN